MSLCLWQDPLYPHGTWHTRAPSGGHPDLSCHPQHAGCSSEPNCGPSLPPHLFLHWPAKHQVAPRHDRGRSRRRPTCLAHVWNHPSPASAPWQWIWLVLSGPGRHVFAGRTDHESSWAFECGAGSLHGPCRRVYRRGRESSLLPRWLRLPVVSEPARPPTAASRLLPQRHPQRQAWRVAGPLHYRLPGTELHGKAPGETKFFGSHIVNDEEAHYIYRY